METKQKIDVQMRWMIRVDLPEILEIERQSFQFAWTEEDFLCCLRQKNCVGMVAIDAANPALVIGFMIYELQENRLDLLNFAVAGRVAGCGVGGSMVRTLLRKLSQQRRREITLKIAESNLNAQQFFRHFGFRAFRVLRGSFVDTDEDAYCFFCMIGVA